MVVREKVNENNLSNQTISFLMTLMELILTRNYFRYGTDFYLQLKQTSMGSTVGPSFANIFLWHLVSSNMLKIVHMLIILPHGYHMWTTCSYCGKKLKERSLSLMNSSIAETNWLSSIGPNINVSFSNYIQIKKEGGLLCTALFSKPTDRNNMLKPDSFHVLQTFKGIPKIQFVRARSICIKDADYRQNMQKIVDRGYNKDHIKTDGEEGKISRDAIRTTRQSHHVYFHIW